MISEATNQDALTGPTRYSVNIPAFEGPLDLLLFLVKKHEVDIYDIPIHEVTCQYLSVLRDMKRLNLEVAGEFFVMAATLMYIKSRMLLPPDETVPIAAWLRPISRLVPGPCHPSTSLVTPLKRPVC